MCFEVMQAPSETGGGELTDLRSKSDPRKSVKLLPQRWESLGHGKAAASVL